MRKVRVRISLHPLTTYGVRTGNWKLIQPPFFGTIDPSYAVLSTLLATPDESDAVLDWIAEHIKLIWFPGVVVPGPGLDGFGDVMTRAEEWLVQCAVHPDADGDGHVGRIFWEECGIGRGRTSRASF